MTQWVGVTVIRFRDKETEIQTGQVHDIQTVLTTTHSEKYILKWSLARRYAYKQPNDIFTKSVLTLKRTRHAIVYSTLFHFLFFFF